MRYIKYWRATRHAAPRMHCHFQAANPILDYDIIFLALAWIHCGSLARGEDGWMMSVQLWCVTASML